jgi:hypothetical protein
MGAHTFSASWRSLLNWFFKMQSSQALKAKPTALTAITRGLKFAAGLSVDGADDANDGSEAALGMDCDRDIFSIVDSPGS